MKMAAHTPGPWIFYADLPSTEPDWHIVTTANKMRVLANVHIEPGNAVDEANAWLIATAPELLVALKELRAALPPISLADPKVWAAYDKARAALAKAEGRSAQ